MAISESDMMRIEYVDRLCELMHKHSAHELVIGDVHIALHPRQAVVASEKPLPDPMIPLRVPSEEEMLFWSSPDITGKTSEDEPDRGS